MKTRKEIKSHESPSSPNSTPNATRQSASVRILSRNSFFQVTNSPARQRANGPDHLVCGQPPDLIAEIALHHQRRQHSRRRNQKKGQHVAYQHPPELPVGKGVPKASPEVLPDRAVAVRAFNPFHTYAAHDEDRQQRRCYIDKEGRDDSQRPQNHPADSGGKQHQHRVQGLVEALHPRQLIRRHKLGINGVYSRGLNPRADGAHGGDCQQQAPAAGSPAKRQSRVKAWQGR